MSAVACGSLSQCCQWLSPLGQTKLTKVTARCHAPLSPWSVQLFSVNALSQACESALTNLDNAQRALSNLLIAHSRIMHSDKHENYAPNVSHIKNTTP